MAEPGVAYNRNCARYKQHSTASTVTVKATPGTVHRIVVGGGSSGVAAGAITVADDTTTVVLLPAGVASNTYEVGVWFGTSIKLTLGHADDEVTVVYT